ncbi:PIG-L family deacetylase [Microbacteriaceae bacterium K1510]|nr:PIG-L family deacetylase [Microbacteriaceae bacterium K1510]
MTNGIARVAFYVSPHEDDWQLFMNPPAFADVLDPACRVVFVHMTAGDAGLGIGNGGRKHPFYLAREHGAEAAIRFMADANEQPPVEPQADIVSLNGQDLRRTAYRNTRTYFLRLPDGSPSGDGYETTGRQSLKRLRNGDIASMTAIDGSAVYRGWNGLCDTLRTLIEHEQQDAPIIDLHIPETDATLNPNDHSDHVTTALAVRDAWRDRPARWHHHVGYASGSRPENLSTSDRDMKCAVYAVTLAGVLAFDHQVSWQHYNQMFIGRNYCRTEHLERS